MDERHGWNGRKPEAREQRTWWMHPRQIERRTLVGEILVTQDGTLLMRNGDVVRPDEQLPVTGVYASPASFLNEILRGIEAA